MNVFLWILQVLLALAFGMAGVLKTTQPKEKLATNMGWVEDFSPGTVKLIGGVEFLAALGLILPAVTGIAPVLTPLAAAGLVVTMIGAIIVHARRHEPQGFVVNIVLLVLSALVAWGRFGPYHF
ncbi:MAG: hypothetical protein JWQ95_3690 [Sphaerisporangium sp.]|nr:hypothetical protein [Sphaerisporangium sp.]